MGPSRPGLRAGQLAAAPGSQARLSRWTLSPGHSLGPDLTYAGGPRLPWEWRVGVRPAQASEPLFVQANVSAPPSQPGINDPSHGQVSWPLSPVACG